MAIGCHKYGTRTVKHDEGDEDFKGRGNGYSICVLGGAGGALR